MPPHLEIAVEQDFQASRLLIGWTAMNLLTPESVQDGTYDVFFLSAFGLMPGHVPVSVKVKSAFFPPSALASIVVVSLELLQEPLHTSLADNLKIAKIALKNFVACLKVHPGC